jgi:hypothetical protein
MSDASILRTSRILWLLIRRTGQSYIKNDRLQLAIAELHSAIFIAIKRPVATGRFWPRPDDQKTQNRALPVAAFEKFQVRVCI